MQFTILVTAAFIIWFTSIWIAVLSLLSFIGGWNSLRKLYPLTLSARDGNAVKYPMSSMKLGFVNYRYCTNISFTGTGIILEMIKIFSVKHKPLFIPYNKISGAKKGKIFSTFTEFMIEGKKGVIYGEAGDELYSRISSSDYSV